MKKRIMAAWKVLRGEWVAHAPVKPTTRIFAPTSTNSAASTLTTVYWKATS